MGIPTASPSFNAPPIWTEPKTKLQKHAKYLYDYGRGQWGTNEKGIHDILNGYKGKQSELFALDNIYQSYAKNTNRNGLLVDLGIEMTESDLQTAEDCFNLRVDGQFSYFNPTWQAQKIYNAGEGHRESLLEGIGRLIPVSWQGTNEDRYFLLVKEIEGNDKWFFDTNQEYGRSFHSDKVLEFKDAQGLEASFYTFGILRAAEKEMSGSDLHRVEDLAPVSPYYTAQILNSAAKSKDSARFLAIIKDLDSFYLYHTNEYHKNQFGNDLITYVSSQFKGPIKDQILEKLKTDQ